MCFEGLTAASLGDRDHAVPCHEGEVVVEGQVLVSASLDAVSLPLELQEG